jgi:beta-carotene/zeaxanthin 4-ketolase
MGIIMALSIITNLGNSSCIHVFIRGIFSPTHGCICILLQGYLYTGLFITGHDAMHGTVARNKP